VGGLGNNNTPPPSARTRDGSPKNLSGWSSSNIPHVFIAFQSDQRDGRKQQYSRKIKKTHAIKNVGFQKWARNLKSNSRPSWREYIFHSRIGCLETNKKQQQQKIRIQFRAEQIKQSAAVRSSAGEYRRGNHDSRWLPHTVTFFFPMYGRQAHTHTPEEEEEEHAVVFQLIYTDTHTHTRRISASASIKDRPSRSKQETNSREIRSELSSSSSDIIFSLSLSTNQPPSGKREKKYTNTERTFGSRAGRRVL
jgi:hypothetical protein